MRVIKFEYVFKHSENGDIKRFVFDLFDIQWLDRCFPELDYEVFHGMFDFYDYMEKLGYKEIAKRQYTSRNDKNGVEIYEDDFLLINGEKRAVEFVDGCFVVSNQEDFYTIDLLDVKECEVIGNKFQK